MPPDPARQATPSTVTRWSAGGSENDGYGQRFGEMVQQGQDVDGEARLADALCPRGARVLDAGAGMGRVSAALAARGHRVLAVDPDAALVAQARRTYPDLAIIESDILALEPGEFDLVVAVGNVMIFLAEETEVAVLTRLRELLAPEGRLLVGFHLEGRPSTSRAYRPEEFVADAEAAGLQVQSRFGSYELHPPTDEYAVWVLTQA